MSAEQQLLMRAAKLAFLPTPGGQIPPPDPAAGGAPPGAMMPPPLDPAMAGGMPPMDPAMMGGMDPAMMGGMPPMDPAMMGGMPPVDPGMAPMDPGMMEDPMAGGEEPTEHINDPNVDYDGNGVPDVMVPLGPITEFATSLIEAVKGRRTAAPKEDTAPNAEEAAQPPGPGAHIGGAPAEQSAPLFGGMV